MKEKGSSPETGSKPSFKFIYVEHDGPENAALAWAELKDCDVILLEEVGFTEKQKAEREKIIEIATQKPWSVQGFYLRQQLKTKNEKNWFYSIISNVIEGYKEFHYIDVESNSPATKMSGIGHKLYTQSFYFLMHGKPWKAVETLKKTVEKIAGSNRIRTDVVIKQIRNLEKNAGGGWNGKTIGIVQGAGHEYSYEKFKSIYPGYVAEKLFALKKTGTPIFFELTKRLEEYPSYKIPRNEIIKTLLAYGPLCAYLNIQKPGEDEDSLYRLTEDIINSLTPQEINQYWFLVTNTHGQDKITEMFWKISYMMSANYGLEKSPVWIIEDSSFG